MNEALELLRVAKELVADDYPVGIFDKGKVALDMLRKGVAEKHIWNADYNDIKFILGRNMEHATKIHSPGVDELVSHFVYNTSEGSPYTFGSLPRFIRDVRSNMNDEAKSRFPAVDSGNNNYDKRNKDILENWDAMLVKVDKYLKDVETWLQVIPLMKEVKPYIEKGRKPIVRPEGYIPRIYVPPMPGLAAKVLVEKKLKEIVESQRAELVEKITKSGIEKLSAFPSGTYDEFKAYCQKEYVDIGYRNFYDTTGYGRDSIMTLKADYQARVGKSAEQTVENMITSYVEKNTSKIAPIVHAKGEPSKVEVGWGNLAGWGFSGEIRFEFSDNTGFTVRNKAVMKTMWRRSGNNWFYQFPTTFHNVKSKDGKVQSMVPEQNMNEVWAKEA